MSPRREIEAWLNQHADLRRPDSLGRQSQVLMRLAKDEPYTWEGSITLREEAFREIERVLGRPVDRAKFIRESKLMLREILDRLGEHNVCFYEYAAPQLVACPKLPASVGVMQPGLFA